MIEPDRRGHITRGVWWTCGAVVSAQLMSLPLAYVLAAITTGLFGWARTGGALGLFFGVVFLVMGLGAVVLVEYGAALLAALTISHYRSGMHDLPARRVAVGAVAGLACGVITVQLLDHWEIALRQLGIADPVQFGFRAGALVGGTLVGTLLGARGWVNAKKSHW